VQQVGVKFYVCLTEVYVIKDNINAFNKTLNKPSKADSAAMLDPHYALMRILNNSVFSSMAPLALQHFTTLSHKLQDFRKKSY